MTFARRIYTKEFRINTAKLVVNEHRPATSVAEELNVSPKTLHSWVKQYREGSLQTAADKHDSVSPEQAETARLRAEPKTEQSLGINIFPLHLISHHISVYL